MRRFQRGLKRKALALIKKLRKAKKEAAAGEKPDAVSWVMPSSVPGKFGHPSTCKHCILRPPEYARRAAGLPRLPERR